MSNVYGYIRVSSADQNEERQIIGTDFITALFCDRCTRYFYQIFNGLKIFLKALWEKGSKAFFIAKNRKETSNFLDFFLY